MSITIDEARRKRIVARIQGHFLEEFDETVSVFRAEQILDLMSGLLAPEIYNQAVQDARKFMQQRLDDLDAEVRVPEVI
jgi:uncharacterized protein (DUF2164 family)